ncbi:MAG: hypothetical protein ACOCTI_05680 [Phycisphaeraceae bacterium]
MSMNVGRARLNRAYKDLLSQWKKCQPRWRDSVSRRFEREHIAPLEARLRTAMSAMEEAGQLLDRARRDCE